MKPLKNQKPGLQLAFLPTADVEALAECMVAFANGSGGLVVLGLDADGRLTEEIYPEDAESALQHAIGMCKPPVPGYWQTIPTAYGNLIGIRVDRSDDLHSLDDGRILVRSGRDNRPLSGDEVTQLAAGRTTGDYEEEVVAGATQADFNEAILAEYIAKRKERGAAAVESRADLLFEIGAVNVDGLPTVAGMLLFGKNPQAFLPQSGVVFVRFANMEPGAMEEGSAGYGRRDEITGPLARIVERAWNIVWEEMRVGAIVNRLEREEVTEYPKLAVRESIINAVCHRDYRIKGRRTEIRMYPDRLEIISPGGLPGYMTLENLVEEHFSRNPRIVNGLYQWGYIEELGLGIDLMIEEMAQAGQIPPKFKATDYSFTVTLSSRHENKPAPPRWTQNMNERQARALTHVQERGSISNRDYQLLCGDVSAETLRRDLADLVQKGVLLKIGSKKGTYYILK